MQSITAQREVDTTAAMEATSEAELRGRISAIRAELGPPLDLLSKIRAAHPAMALAAEFKRASPSKGVIAGGLGAAEQAVRYFGAGASVISTLTEERNFQGTLADLEAVRRATQAAAGGAPRPAVLRKDFITSRFMILEAAAAGADTVLLIVAVTPSDVLKDLIAFSRELGMEPLVEVHADEELPVALEAGARVLGVNNRNLHNFKMDLATTERTAAALTALGVNFDPSDPAATHALCSLSGMSNSEDVARYRACGVAMCLIGESLMRAVDPAAAIRSLRLDPSAAAPSSDSAGGAYTAGLKLVKVCGITRESDALAACRAGASLVGVIFAPNSKRRATRAQAASISKAVRAFGERDGPSAPATPLPPTPSLNQRTLSFLSSCRRPQVVGVFQNQPASEINEAVRECELDFVQLHGDEGMAACADIDVPVIRVVDVAAGDEREADVIGREIVESLTDDPSCILLDTSVRGVGGGAGVTFNWGVAKYLQASGFGVMVAGGLNARNVVDVVGDVVPMGVDVSSGVEAEPGVKDVGEVEDFVRAALLAGIKANEGI
ncbi:hypothetical protein TeGR_g9037 [Tetraparma gracilis]|uniref:Indole-3-glycerol phosphate synthase n=1 Tax=Tetraparma gracilis TaxID=2962635 RepID=A0ABQ6MFE3_9STRA|nr:hypothetical protein TeGR_g9037 [Tetraparma gracilis]